MKSYRDDLKIVNDLAEQIIDLLDSHNADIKLVIAALTAVISAIIVATSESPKEISIQKDKFLDGFHNLHKINMEKRRLIKK
jgi:hypothetical protein